MLITTFVNSEKPRVKISSDEKGTYITVEFGESLSLTCPYVQWSAINRQILMELGITLDDAAR